jgi:CheY-like chemotaxis protein/HPt (histidine-containing phosphotransfer) domain-containing protein
LLVEDNPVNREVAQLLLEGHGVVVDEAASGLEALDLFEERRYDAILMDIQMPIMNGIEATARIRTHYDPVKAATPILALTANAFRADAEKYAAAGMNDTLPKPFDEAELLNKLATLMAGGSAPEPRKADAVPSVSEASHQPQPAAEKPVDTPPPTQPQAAAPLFDLTVLSQTAHGSTAFMNRILASFHTNTPGSVADLRAAQEAADWPAAAAIAHKLRPSLRLVGAVNLVPCMAVLEAHTAADHERQAAAQELEMGLEELLKVLPKKLDA